MTAWETDAFPDAMLDLAAVEILQRGSKGTTEEQKTVIRREDAECLNRAPQCSSLPLLDYAVRTLAFRRFFGLALTQMFLYSCACSLKA